ncbi:hypothetical protein [Vallitalea okinawensis]|uniref:hypothetical protein n=1 Tax=Vallitalea okinawensis TaxID=2078660 RepID=UPI000CFD73BA|nr:hypothetical protein [Vallitalea okinawensis]
MQFKKIQLFPVITNQEQSVLLKLEDFILGIIDEEIVKFFSQISLSMNGLTAIKHGIQLEEIANELWQQVFGEINEYLIQEGVFQKPKYKKGEGRYLQCIYFE